MSVWRNGGMIFDWGKLRTKREKLSQCNLSIKNVCTDCSGIKLSPPRLFVFSFKIYVHLAFHIGNNSIICPLFDMI